MKADESQVNAKVTQTPHPAKFSPVVLGVIRDLIREMDERLDWSHTKILDPFAGVGGIHLLNDGVMLRLRCTFAIELEPEWAAESAKLGPTWCGDFFDFEKEWGNYPPDGWDAVVTSPTYGNRMADHHVARDASRRLTYTHRLGRQLTANNSGGMQWGIEYKVFHNRAWRRVSEILRPGGLFILNVKDHVRAGQLVPVSRWHRDNVLKHGFELLEDRHVEVKGMGFGKNQTLNEGLKVDYEHVYAFRRVQSQASTS